MAAVKGIEAWQHGRIRGLAAKLGMDSDDLHAFAGVESMTQLSKVQADDVIARLKALTGSDTAADHKPAKKPPRPSAPDMATQGQQKKVIQLMYQLQELSPSEAVLGTRLCGIIHKELGMDAKPFREFQWMSRKACDKLIEVLKGYIATARKKAGEAHESH